MATMLIQRENGKGPGLARVVGHFLLMWVAVPLSLGAASFTASLDRDFVSLGETVTLSLSFAGVSSPSVPPLPQIPNLQVQYVGPSSQITVNQGQMTSVVTHNFRVTPTQPGDYTIPAISVDAGGTTLTTKPVTLKVLKPNAPSAEAVASGEQLAFLKLLVPKKRMYVGESSVAQLQLYLRRGVQGIRDFQFTTPVAETSKGWLAGKLSEGSQRGQAQVGNTIYTVIPLMIPIKALRAGELELGPITASVVVEVPSQNRRRDSMFEQFGMRDPFGMFGGTEGRQVPMATGAEKIEVLPLPETGVPPGFAGAIGSYEMEMSAGPTNLTAGDPITVKIQISGRGSLDSVSLPESAAGWSEFKTYPPTVKTDVTDPLGLQGTKTFEQIVVPENGNIKALPAMAFSFFDPDQGKYRTLSHAPIPLLVRPAGTVATPTIATARAGQESPPPAQDIVPIKQRLGTVAQAEPVLLRQAWFLGLQSVPMLALIASAVWRRRADSLARNPRLRRQREVAGIVRCGLADLRRLAVEKNSDPFFATLFRLLQEQLGERLDLPASAITEAVIDERLRPMGLNGEMVEGLQELFQKCNLARYAPIRETGELTGLADKTEEVLRQLQRIKA